MRRPLLQPGAGDERWSRSCGPLTAERRDHRRRRGPSPRPAARSPVEVKDRAGFIVNALLFPYLNNAVRMLENGTASARRHRRRHEGRLQLPDGPARPARPRRPRHLAGHPRRALRRVPRPELRRRAAAAPHGRAPASSAGSPARASTTTPSADAPAAAARRAAAQPRGRSRPRRTPTTTASSASGADLEPGTLLAAYRCGHLPDAGRPAAAAAGVVVARPAGRPPARRPAGEPVAAPVVRAASRSASTPPSTT